MSLCLVGDPEFLVLSVLPRQLGGLPHCHVQQHSDHAMPLVRTDGTWMGAIYVDLIPILCTDTGVEIWSPGLLNMDCGSPQKSFKYSSGSSVGSAQPKKMRRAIDRFTIMNAYAAVFGCLRPHEDIIPIHEYEL